MLSIDKVVLGVCLAVWYLLRLTYFVVVLSVPPIIAWLMFNGLVLLTSYFTVSGEPLFCAGALAITKRVCDELPWPWRVAIVGTICIVLFRATYKDIQRQTENPRFFPDTKNDPFSWYRDD